VLLPFDAGRPRPLEHCGTEGAGDVGSELRRTVTRWRRTVTRWRRVSATFTPCRAVALPGRRHHRHAVGWRTRCFGWGINGL